MKHRNLTFQVSGHRRLDRDTPRHQDSLLALEYIPPKTDEK